MEGILHCLVKTIQKRRKRNISMNLIEYCTLYISMFRCTEDPKKLNNIIEIIETVAFLKYKLELTIPESLLFQKEFYLELDVPSFENRDKITQLILNIRPMWNATTRYFSLSANLDMSRFSSEKEMQMVMKYFESIGFEIISDTQNENTKKPDINKITKINDAGMSFDDLEDPNTDMFNPNNFFRFPRDDKGEI